MNKQVIAIALDDTVHVGFTTDPPPDPEEELQNCDLIHRYTSRTSRNTSLIAGYWCNTHQQWAFEDLDNKMMAEA